MVKVGENWLSVIVDQAEVIPFCQSLDLSEYETDSSLLSSISYSIVSETDRTVGA